MKDKNTNYNPIDYRVNKDLKSSKKDSEKNSLKKTIYLILITIFMVVSILFLFYKDKYDRLNVEFNNQEIVSDSIKRMSDSIIIVNDSLQERIKALEIELKVIKREHNK